MNRQDAGVRRTALACAVAMCVSVFGNPAHAAEGAFRVTVYVPPHGRDALVLRDRVPMPIGAVRLTRDGRADSYAFAGTPDDAARHYRAAMVQRGFRLVAQHGDLQAWEDGRQRVELRLTPVLGTPAATRIVLIARSAGG